MAARDENRRGAIISPTAFKAGPKVQRHHARGLLDGVAAAAQNKFAAGLTRRTRTPSAAKTLARRRGSRPGGKSSNTKAPRASSPALKPA